MLWRVQRKGKKELWFKKNLNPCKLCSVLSVGSYFSVKKFVLNKLFIQTPIKCILIRPFLQILSIGYDQLETKSIGYVRESH